VTSEFTNPPFGGEEEASEPAIRQAAGLFPGSRIAWDFEGLSLLTFSKLSVTPLRQRAAGFSVVVRAKPDSCS
jgi:hypothetical protein